MVGKDIMQIALMGISYYLFSNEFFKFTADIKEEKISYSTHFLCFFFVYLWFVFASYLELPLVINWFVFLILLGLEVHIVFSFDYLVSYGLSLFCIIMGLAVNVFSRNLASIMLNISLQEFDNSRTALKFQPILIGFIVMVLLLYVLRRIRFSQKLKRMLYYRKSLTFYTWTEVFIYLFLMIQLLAFSQSNNEIGIKLWGIKSAIFSVIVLVITIFYSLHVASLHYYMDKQHTIRNHLIQEKQDINKLWKLAYTDMLTGFNNRQLLFKRLKEYANYGGDITLAFIDINGLKATNDQYGHMEGDNYLIAVSRVLFKISAGLNIDIFRYGGDEFICMSNTLSETEITALLNRANGLLESEPAQYSRSISFGVVRGNCTDYENLIALADNQMYQHKLKHYENMIRT